MKNYQTLLFDVDNTLLDFGAAEDAALALLFEEQNLPLTAEVKARYKALNQRLWEAYEEEKIDIDTLLNTRFEKLFREYGRVVDGELFEESYRIHLGESHVLVDGAFELIEQLKNDYDLYIVSNGLRETQNRRLKDSKLYSYFKGIFVSEDAGFQKPKKEFFNYVFKRIPNISVDKCLMIGDSLTADIKGGELVGLDTCWLNPDRKPNDTEIRPTYEIQKLDELFHVLGLRTHTS